MAQIFSAAGFQSKVINNNKLTMVQAVFWTPDIFGGAIPQSCEKDGGCRAFKIFANLGKSSVGQAWVDAWNSSWLYVRAYFSNGELIFSWDVGMFSGVTQEYLVTEIKTFKGIVDQSTDFKP